MRFHSEKWKKLLILLGTAGVIYISFYYLLPLVVPFVLAFVFAKMVKPVVCKLHKFTHINQKAGSVLVILVFLGGFGSFAFYIAYLCTGQLSEALRNLPAHLDACVRLCRRMCGGIDNLLGLQQGNTYSWIENCVVNADERISDTYLPKLTGYIPHMLVTLGEWGAAFLVFLMATLLISFEPDVNIRYRSILPYIRKLRTTGFAYLKVQGIIMFLVAAVSAAGLCLIRNPYALLLGILIGIVDAFPVLGSGSILVPWAVAELIGKDFFQAAVLLTIYVITMLAREVMETHLMGKEIGLKPLYVLMSVYVGMKLFGVGGIFLGPVGLTILKTVAET